MHNRSDNILIFVLIVVMCGFACCNHTISEDPEKRVIVEAMDWIMSSYPDNIPVYYISHEAWSQLSRNRENSKTGIIIEVESDIRKMPTGALLFWDSQSSPNEPQFQKDSVMFRRDLRLVSVLRPQPEIPTTKGRPLEVLYLKKRYSLERHIIMNYWIP